MIPIEKSDEEKVSQLCEKLYKKLDSTEEINRILLQNKNEYIESDKPFFRDNEGRLFQIKKT